MEYYKTLHKLHSVLRPKLYLEIGIRAGESMSLAFGDTEIIGIDPEYKIIFPYLKKGTLVKDTSDNFIKKTKYKDILIDKKIDFSFIDGMHLFEYVLRDFINIEKHSSENGVIAIHDCMVKDKVTASRERTTSFWTGDVWKIINILQEYRPDLEIILLDSKPSGLALIKNLNPASNVLHEKYEEIVNKFMDLEFKNSLRYPHTPEENFDFSKLIKKQNKNKQSVFRKISSKPKMLAVLLCYNDADILEDNIKYLTKENKHDLIVWDHGSDDGTDKILEKYADQLIEYKFVPREFDFYKLYEAMSKNLIKNYIENYDWISWPDQDEFLEGPDRKKPYYKYIYKAYRSKYNWIQFNNYNFWFTNNDDPSIKSPIHRIKHYSLFPDVSPRIRSWRASETNIRRFNHNQLKGDRYPEMFNLRHYPMRSEKQMKRRLEKDRADLQRNDQNFHYNNMKKKIKLMKIDPAELHTDDGSNLNNTLKFDWNKIYRDLD